MKNLKKFTTEAEGRANRTKGSLAHEGGKRPRNLALCVPSWSNILLYMFSFFIHTLNRDRILV
jgi:hypothetical protein